MSDAYDCSLWDIDPVCQVAAICDNDTVVLDGARGATIEWSKFDYIWHTTGPSWKRLIAEGLIRFGWVLPIFGILFIQVGLGPLSQPYNDVLIIYYLLFAFGVILLVTWLAILLINPLLVRTTLAGKIQDIQGAFYGVEGYLNPATVDRLIFGCNFGRFKWSSHGSLLSQFEINEHKEKVGIDPCVYAKTRAKVEAARKAGPTDMRVSNTALLRCISTPVLIKPYRSSHWLTPLIWR